jgi:hypothetical protein
VALEMMRQILLSQCDKRYFCQAQLMKYEFKLGSCISIILTGEVLQWRLCEIGLEDYSFVLLSRYWHS